MATALLVTAVFAACYAMFAKRLSSTVFTAPMLFIAFGVALSMTGMFPKSDAEHLLHVVAEITLILLLFLDASQISLKALREDHDWPVRMLLIGLPASVVLGVLAAWLFLPAWSLATLALVAALLAPTDAALGQAVVSNPIVPERSRRALTVESGLNDGPPCPLSSSLPV